MLSRLTAVLLLLVALCLPAQALPLRGGGGSSSDQMTAALAATCSGCWLDAGAFVATSPTVASVVWSCSTTPCGGGFPSDAPLASTLGAQSAIMQVWAGAVVDTDHNYFLIHTGGGHQSYYGTAIYAFDFAALQFKRLNVPHTMVGFTTGTGANTFPDGQPLANHGYSGDVYVPGTGYFELSICSLDTGGCGVDSFSVNIGTLNPLQYATWTVRPNAPANLAPGQVSCYDSSSGKIFLYGSAEAVPLQYLASPYTGSWTSTGGSAITNGSEYSVACRPGVEMAVVGAALSAGKNYQRVSLTTGNALATTFSGDSTIPNCSAPGWDWDSSAGKYVGWCGGTTVYIDDPATDTFTAHAAAGGNTVTPLCSQVGCTSSTGTLTQGTFGRFRYLAKYNAFCLVNTTDDHVYCYKPDF